MEVDKRVNEKLQKHGMGYVRDLFCLFDGDISLKEIKGKEVVIDTAGVREEFVQHRMKNFTGELQGMRENEGISYSREY